ncbi:MAG TPA: UDP-N-acetylmuramate--L-alanine ligase [Planctomycetes bacterium]|nr:UDP-N-acetylmuramate--L-alanine ligase [Planctomycetota bacterium]HIL37318.1 UDP-N-acetylmuramate--L-alanine ligase [Planctomycetota bacterium]
MLECRGSIWWDRPVQETHSKDITSTVSTSSPRLVPGIAQRVHLLGAGGAGMSAIGQLLQIRGHVVSGHDPMPSAFVSALESSGVVVASGPSASNHWPSDVQTLIRSAAVPDSDPQVLAAEAAGVPVLRYKHALGAVTGKDSLAVAGTHGKTTTTWMLFEALGGLDQARSLAGMPLEGAGILVGGLHQRLGCNVVAPMPGAPTAVEACEYDRTFLELSPRGGIVTNLEADHLDYYGSMEALEGAFARFAAGIDPGGLLVLSSDAPEFLREAACCEVWTLGREYDVELHGEDRGYFSIRIVGPGWASGVVRLQVPGRFNVDNAAAAVALAVGLSARGDSGLDQALLAEHAARGVARYEGTKRRFESWGEVQGVQVVHDYAHHPTEVRVTLEAARRVFPGLPLHVFFQPHQASRTHRFLKEFIESLRGADRVVVADVYGARQTIDGRQAGAEDLAVGLRRAGLDASAGGGLKTALAELVQGIVDPAAVLVLGAGDIDSTHDDLLSQLALRLDS